MTIFFKRNLQIPPSTPTNFSKAKKSPSVDLSKPNLIYDNQDELTKPNKVCLEGNEFATLH